MVFLCFCGGLIWNNRVHVCGHIRCSCGAIKFNGRGHCCGYTPDYSVPPTDWELYSGYRSSDEWMGSTTWGKRSPSLFNTKNQEKCILNNASSMEDIKNLKQTDSFQDYCKSFDSLLTKLILSEDYATNLFVEGLKPEIMHWVKFLKPKTLEEAYETAKNQASLLSIIESYSHLKEERGQTLSNNEIRCDEFDNWEEIREIIVEEIVDNDVLDGNGVHEPMKVYEDREDIQEEIDVREFKESVVDVKHAVDNKSGDVNDSDEGIKENVNGIYVNVIDNDVDVKEINKESDDDVKEIEKETVVDVKRFGWKPGWVYCSSGMLDDTLSDGLARAGLENKKISQLEPEEAEWGLKALEEAQNEGLCGGKMHITDRQWTVAAADFFEALKNYDEAGNQIRIQCLKYLYRLYRFSCCVVYGPPFGSQKFGNFSYGIMGSKTAHWLVSKTAVAAQLGSKAANGLTAVLVAQLELAPNDDTSQRLMGQVKVKSEEELADLRKIEGEEVNHVGYKTADGLIFDPFEETSLCKVGFNGVGFSATEVRDNCKKKKSSVNGIPLVIHKWEVGASVVKQEPSKVGFARLLVEMDATDILPKVVRAFYPKEEGLELLIQPPDVREPLSLIFHHFPMAATFIGVFVQVKGLLDMVMMQVEELKIHIKKSIKCAEVILSQFGFDTFD